MTALSPNPWTTREFPVKAMTITFSLPISYHKRSSVHICEIEYIGPESDYGKCCTFSSQKNLPIGLKLQVINTEVTDIRTRNVLYYFQVATAKLCVGIFHFVLHSTIIILINSSQTMQISLKYIYTVHWL